MTDVKEIVECWDWLEDCGIAVDDVDYSIVDRVSTRLARLMQKITGYGELIFLINGEKR